MNIKFPLTAEPPLKDFPVIETEKYILRLASTKEELESVFRLRFEIFNIELGLEYSTSNLTRIDQDEFDPVCHHLILIFKATGKIVGNYRMQSYTMASQALGFSAAKYFNINDIPDSMLQETVELGRACIVKEYRNIQALLLLWKGLANYLIWSQNQYFLGRVTFKTQNPLQARCAYNYFQHNNLMHPSILVYPNSEFSLELPQQCPSSYNVEIPHILQAYFACGAKICSLPSIGQFKCITFLTIFNSTDFARYQ
ncbi:GNAT family N-acetyltransferase [Nostoc sp.]|uniref:GNAT family N-acetyltransferase n=1 Tax=Nostoc sp. TaxID=1180 RepID=UPI002FFCE6BF